MSDVIVYVNTVPAKRESMYLDRVLEFVEKSQAGVSSAEVIFFKFFLFYLFIIIIIFFFFKK